MIDNGASETAAVADVNKDGRLDIISGENWYEAPARWRRPGAVDEAQVPRTELHQQLLRQLQRSSGRRRRRRLSRPRPGDVVREEDLVVEESRTVPSRVGRQARQRPRPAQPVAGMAVGFGGEKRTDDLWQELDIHTGFNIEFAVLADMDNDGKANEVVAQENGTPQAWYEAKNGAWVAHVVSDKSYGHGIGAGDVNGDKRTDILTPRGWLEAPADPRAGNWTFQPDWEAINVPLPVAGAAAAAAAGAPAQPKLLELGFMHVLDVNGDGRNDVIAGAGHNYGLFWFEQGEDGQWTRRTIDASWSQAHASTLVDLNGDGRLDIVTGKRFMAHNGSDPGEKEPLGVYWYEFASAHAVA